MEGLTVHIGRRGMLLALGGVTLSVAAAIGSGRQTDDVDAGAYSSQFERGPVQAAPVQQGAPVKRVTLSGAHELSRRGQVNLDQPGGTNSVRAQAVIGGNIRFNRDNSFFPQNETSIAINPLNALNVVGSANDYRI